MIDIVSSLGVLRAIKPEELTLMLSWRNAPSVRSNMYTQHEINLDEHLSWWSRIQNRSDQKYFMYENQGKPFGIVAFNGIDPIHRNSSWAFYASPQAQKGTGSKMEFLALDYAFKGMSLHKLSCEVLAFNAAVIKLHQKFGFRVEGILREQFKAGDGFVDIHRLGMLASEWVEHRQKMLEKILHLSNK
jgi:UDP-4-amino-4,6-dideoxy-N-acetyl-beta-L-altrosamine N-acetyltransferase